ncbi:hypothetical protein Tco_1452531 [Tanacetum coccineum]
MDCLIHLEPYGGGGFVVEILDVTHHEPKGCDLYGLISFFIERKNNKGNEGWKRCVKEMIKEMGMDIEAAIFEFLDDELAQEPVNSC